jgi:hypothetical protein
MRILCKVNTRKAPVHVSKRDSNGTKSFPLVIGRRRCASV